MDSWKSKICPVFVQAIPQVSPCMYITVSVAWTNIGQILDPQILIYPYFVHVMSQDCPTLEMEIGPRPTARPLPTPCPLRLGPRFVQGLSQGSSRFTLSGQGLGSGRVMGRGPFLRLENLKTSCGHSLDILWIFIQYLTKICSTLEYCDVHTFSHNCVTWTKGGQKVDTLDISMSLVIVQLLSCFRVTRWQTVKS